MDIPTDLAKLDDGRYLGPIKLALGLLLKLSQNILDIRVIAELAALQLGLEHVLGRTIDKHASCLYALARTDFLEDELWSGLLALVQGRVHRGSSGINNSKHNPLAEPLSRLGIVEGVMY